MAVYLSILRVLLCCEEHVWQWSWVTSIRALLETVSLNLNINMLIMCGLLVCARCIWRNWAQSYISPSLSEITLFAFSLSWDLSQKMLILRCSSNVSWSTCCWSTEVQRRRKLYMMLFELLIHFPSKGTNFSHRTLDFFFFMFETRNWKKCHSNIKITVAFFSNRSKKLNQHYVLKDTAAPI